MANDLSLAIRLFLESRGFEQGLARSGRGVRGFTRGVAREFGALKRTLGTAQGQFAALGASVGVTATIMKSARLDKTLTQIGQTAGVSRRDVELLRGSLFRMAKETGQQVEELSGGFNNLVQSGLSWREALATVEAINPAIAVTGANAQVLASGLTVAAQAFQFDLGNIETAKGLLDKMVVAGRLGNAELENLSGIFSRVGVNAKAANFSFDQTLAFIEQLSMIERQPERLATLADSTLRIFTNLEYMKRAQAATGVDFFDTSGARRDPTQVLAEISAKYARLTTDKQRADAIASAFGQTDLDTQRGLRTLLSGDNVAGISRMSQQLRGATGTLHRDLDAALNNAVDQSGRLARTLREAADDFAKPVNNAISRGVKYLLDTKEQGGLGLSGKDLLAGGAALAGGTLLAGRYGGKALKALAGKFGGVGVGVATGKALEQAAGVMPVYVVNMPGGGFGDSAAGAALGGAAGGAVFSKAKTALAMLLGAPSLGAIRMMGAGAMSTAGAGVVAAGAAGYAAGTLINKGIDATITKALGREASIGTLIADLVERQQQAVVKIEVEGKDGATARVRGVRSNGMDVEADAGIALSGGS